MANFRVVIEGVFVSASHLGRAVGGFFATFFVAADDKAHAVTLAVELLASRAVRHDVTSSGRGLFNTYLVLAGVWAADEALFEEHAGRDLGFSFFRIAGPASLALAIRGRYLKWCKPSLILGTDVFPQRGSSAPINDSIERSQDVVKRYAE